MHRRAHAVAELGRAARHGYRHICGHKQDTANCNSQRIVSCGMYMHIATYRRYLVSLRSYCLDDCLDISLLPSLPSLPLDRATEHSSPIRLRKQVAPSRKAASCCGLVVNGTRPPNSAPSGACHRPGRPRCPRTTCPSGRPSGGRT